MKRLLFSFLLGILLVPTPFTYAQAQETSATLELRLSNPQLKAGQEALVDIYLKNPSSQNIISVRSWIQYDPTLLEGVSIDTEGTPFSLAAPGENEFSPSEGVVKIGRSNIAGGFNQTETKVATVKFKVIGNASADTPLTFYDYQTTELGHTSVNIIDQGFPVNILKVEPQGLSLALNGSSTPAGVGGPTKENEPSSLERPINIKLTTGSGYVDLKWLVSQNPELKGYNLYYGKTSGQYTRRRSLDLVDHYRLEGLNNGEVYYFALTAYDAQNRESDYSDEVAVIVNEPLSSTAPFEVDASAQLANVPVQPQNGPWMGWLGVSALGLGGVMAFRKRSTKA